jgi:hypothetical protein
MIAFGISADLELRRYAAEQRRTAVAPCDMPLGSKTVNDILFIFLVLTLGFGGLFSFVYVIDRSSKAQGRTGNPPRLIPISALIVGLAGITATFGLGVGLPWFVLPLSLVLVTYGLFGLFGSVGKRPN